MVAHFIVTNDCRFVNSQRAVVIDERKSNEWRDTGHKNHVSEDIL